MMLRYLQSAFVACTLVNASPVFSWTEAQIDFFRTVSRPVAGCVNSAIASAKAEGAQRYRVGAALFFDHKVSLNGRQSCASCHRPQQAWSDGLRTPTPESDEKRADRNTPSLLNVSQSKWLTWDGAAASLETHAPIPLMSASEMGSSIGILESLSRETAAYHADYQDFVKSGKGNDRIRWFSDRIALFERSLVSCGSKLDRVAASALEGSNNENLTDDEISGMNIFIGKGNCILCHNGPQLSDGQFHNIRVGVKDVQALIDTGRYGVVARKNKEKDHYLNAEYSRVVLSPYLWGAFKTPSLRNVALTGPYMHSGSLQSLNEVIEHYSEFSNAAPADHHQDVGLAPLRLSHKEKGDLVQFLESLTDREYTCAEEDKDPHACNLELRK